MKSSRSIHSSRENGTRARAEALVLRMVRERRAFRRGRVGRFVITSFSGSSTAMRRGALASSSSRTQPSSTLNSITRVLLGDAGALPERADRGRRKAAAAHAGQRRHARIVPAVDEAVLHERHQLALAHHRVVEIAARELDLLRRARRRRQGRRRRSGSHEFGMMRQVDLIEAPVVQRAVILELERAQRMRDAFDRVGHAVRVVVHRIDRPGVAGVLVRDLADAVDRRIAQVDVAATPCRSSRAACARRRRTRRRACGGTDRGFPRRCARGTASCGRARSACRGIRALRRPTDRRRTPCRRG